MIDALKLIANILGFIVIMWLVAFVVVGIGCAMSYGLSQLIEVLK